jgi:branched-chain amino acid transport system substrate-binding protein
MIAISRRAAMLLPLALPLAARVQPARADHPPVLIGATFPLSGSSGSAGQEMKAAVELGIDIVNNPHPELKDLPLAPTMGLPNLQGRKIAVDFADHQGSPAVAQSQTLRLITQDRVVAMTGAYQSSCTLTSSAVAERYGIPFVNGESSAPNLTTRGYKWFFRTTPIGTDFAKTYHNFLADLQNQGQDLRSITLVNENTDYGTSTATAVLDAFNSGDIRMASHIQYNANSADLSTEVLQMKQANTGVVIFVSYTSDSILFIKTMRSLNYKPTIAIGDDAGFSDPAFIKSVGSLAQGAIDRNAFGIGKPGSTSNIVNAMYKAKTGNDMDDTSARSLQGFLVLCDAINRAGSTEPEKVRAALTATDLKPSQLIMGYKGVNFNVQGQNILASTLLVQLQGTGYVPIWPAADGTAKLQLPFKGWA